MAKIEGSGIGTMSKRITKPLVSRAPVLKSPEVLERLDVPSPKVDSASNGTGNNVDQSAAIAVDADIHAGAEPTGVIAQRKIYFLICYFFIGCNGGNVEPDIVEMIGIFVANNRKDVIQRSGICNGEIESKFFFIAPCMRRKWF